MKRALISVMVALFVAGCGPGLLGDESHHDPEQLFEEFWQSYDRYYAHFEIKGVDWDDVYAEYRPKVGPDTSDEELFKVFSDMIRQLEDGHVYLVSDERRASSDRQLRGNRQDYDAAVVQNHYLNGVRIPTRGEEFVYGRVGHQIGYLRLRTLSGDGGGQTPSGWVDSVVEAVDEMSDTHGMIIDLRNNSGGRAFNSQYIAGLFATERKPFMVTRSRNGPEHDDFSAPNRWYTEPNDQSVYRRPVVVLTNRRTFSAAEWLTLALRQFDHVVHIGTHTGGGLAMFLPRQLSNGWMYTISVQDARGPEGRSFERVGVPPDRYLENGEETLEQGRDAMMEAAIEILEQ